MLYLVTGEFDNGDTYEAYMDWEEIYGITDSLELGKEWILEKKQEFEDICKAEIESKRKHFPDDDWDFIGVDSYEETEEEDYFRCFFHVQEGVSCDLNCIFEVKKIELNTNLTKK